jgi:REP element-mobilizing transposase RayT
MEPIYTAENTKAAYQLNWSVALFGAKEIPLSTDWLPLLKPATDPDGVRILECHRPSSNVIQFLISALPALSPSQIVRSVKGRLQYVIRAAIPKAFRRNYFIGSVGEVNSRVLDQYVGKQAGKHPMADAAVQSRIESLQFHDSRVDLSSRRTGTYGQYVHSLQIVLENSEDWHEVRDDVLLGSRNMIIRCAAKKGWLLSRIGILSNHIHILVGIGVNESPESAALSLLNNLAFAQGWKRVFKFSYYAGTFGRYDRNAIRRAVNEA